MGKKRKVKSAPEEYSDHANKEIIPYIDYITDPRRLEACKILAYHGYTLGADNRNRGAVLAVAKALGINRVTVYAWLKDPLMWDAIEEVKAKFIAYALDGMMKLVRQNDFSACAFMLEKLAPEQYSNDFRRNKYIQEQIHLKKELEKEIIDHAQLPTIVIEPMRTPEYERNKIDE